MCCYTTSIEKFAQPGGPQVDAKTLKAEKMTLSDLLQLLAHFMQPVNKENFMYDLNGDGMITTTDLILLLSQLI